MANIPPLPPISPLPPVPRGALAPPAVGIGEIPNILAAMFQGQMAGEAMRRQRESEALAQETERLRQETLKANLAQLDLQAKADTLAKIREAFGDVEAAKIFASHPGLAEIYRQVYGVEPTVEVTKTVQTPKVTPSTVRPPEAKPLEAPKPGMAPRERVEIREETVAEKVPRHFASQTSPELVQRLLQSGSSLLQTQAARLDNLISQMRTSGQINTQQIWTAVQRYNATVQMLRDQGLKSGLTPIEVEAYFPSITQVETENIIKSLRQPAPLSPKEFSEIARAKAVLNFLSGKSTPEERMLIFGGKDPYNEDSRIFLLGGREYRINDLTDAKIYYMTDPQFRAWVNSQGPEVVRMVTGMDPYGGIDPRKTVTEAQKLFQAEYTKLQGLIAKYKQLRQQLQDLSATPQSQAQNATIIRDLTKQVSEIAGEISAAQARLTALIKAKEYIQDPSTGQWVWVDLDAVVAQYAGKVFPYQDIWNLLSPEGRQYLRDNGVYPPGAVIPHSRGR